MTIIINIHIYIYIYMYNIMYIYIYIHVYILYIYMYLSVIPVGFKCKVTLGNRNWSLGSSWIVESAPGHFHFTVPASVVHKVAGCSSHCLR